jgi:hypothetical protein
LLEETLSAAGLHHVFLGEELGGYRHDGYEAYMSSPAFAQGVEALSRGRTRRMGCLHVR